VLSLVLDVVVLSSVLDVIVFSLVLDVVVLSLVYWYLIRGVSIGVRLQVTTDWISKPVAASGMDSSGAVSGSREHRRKPGRLVFTGMNAHFFSAQESLVD
jgi:uncharacterized membrane protein